MTAENFFKELKRLIEADPKPPVHAENCENCNLADHVYYSKNLTYCFDCLKCTDCVYTYDSVRSAKCVDCDYVADSELLYECVDTLKSFNCEFLEDCSHMTDSSYSVGCRNCHDVFGCVNLRNKSFCIFNRQLSEEEYRTKIQQYKKWPAERVLAVVSELKKRYPVTQTHEENNENSAFGNYIYFNKNCYLCFDASYNTDSGYIYDSSEHKTSYDITQSSTNELSYEVTDSANCFNCNYVVYSAHCQDSSYVFNCLDVKNSLGVVGKAHKQYVILNRQFTKEEYERLSALILEDIKNKNLGWNDLTYY